MPAVQCMCTGNAIITYFTPFDPALCDKKCHSERTPDPLSAFRGKGLGTKLRIAETIKTILLECKAGFHTFHLI